MPIQSTDLGTVNRQNATDTPNNKSKKKTNKTFNGANDIRSSKASGKYPNQHVIKTRSGHNIIYDDSKGNESITIQHRGGSAIQFLPNGSIQTTAHNGKYDIVFGENRISVTGAYDISVKGDCSMRVHGNYRQTVHGDIEVSATGSIAYRGKNIIHTASENISSVSQTQTHKASDAYTAASMQHTAILGKDTTVIGTGTASLGGTRTKIEGVELASINSTKGNMEMFSKTGFNHKTEGDVNLEFAQNYSKSVGQNRSVTVAGNDSSQTTGDRSRTVTGKDYKVAGQIHMNGQQGNSPESSQVQLSLFEPGSLSHGNSQKDNNTAIA